MSKTQIAAGLATLAVVFAIGAIAGAIGTATTALIVAGGAYLIGFISMGTAQAIALWMVAGGALLGGVGWSLWALVLGASA